MKAVNTNSNNIIVNDKVLYTDKNNSNSVVGFILLDRNEKLELEGFKKVELNGNELRLTK